MKRADLARLCHQVNKAYCEAIGDTSQVDWEEAPDWQQRSAFNTIVYLENTPDAPDSFSHDIWLKQKVEEGWIWGREKDPEAKIHPCIMPFERLPLDQQIKDTLFAGTVRACLPLLED